MTRVKFQSDVGTRVVSVVWTRANWLSPWAADVAEREQQKEDGSAQEAAQQFERPVGQVVEHEKHLAMK